MIKKKTPFLDEILGGEAKVWTGLGDEKQTEYSIDIHQLTFLVPQANISGSAPGS